MTSYRVVPLTEQIEKYCCGLPKELRNYCTKIKVTTLTQLIENAKTGNALLLGQSSGFGGSQREGKSEKITARRPFIKDSYQSVQTTGKARQLKKKPEKFFGRQIREQEKPFVRKTPKEMKALMAAKK